MPGFIVVLFARAALFRTMLSIGPVLNFFSTTLGRLIALALVIGGAYVLGHATGTHWARVDCSAKIERMVEESKSAAETRDTEIQTEAKKLADTSTQQLIDLNKTLETKVKAYESDILKTKSGVPACKLGPNDIKRLRGI